MIVHEKLEQGSPEWLAIRKGRATASEFDKILTPTGKLSTQRLAYVRKLARECVCDDPLEFEGNRHTQWGHDMEPEARAEFTERMGWPVQEVGFCQRGDGAPLGCSPDGLIPDASGYGWAGGLEIKCPQVDTHVTYVMQATLPDKYRLQVHGSMAVTGLPWWYFMSFFPGLEPLIVKVERDAFTETLAAALDVFVKEYAKERERVLSAILPRAQFAATEMKPLKESLI